VSAVERGLLESARVPDPTRPQQDMLWASLSRQLAAPAAGAAVASSGYLRSGVLTRWALMLGATMAAVATAGVVALSHGSRAAPTPPSIAAAATVAPLPIPSGYVEKPLPAALPRETPPVVPVTPPRAPRREPTPVVAQLLPRVATAEGDEDPLRAESALVLKARKAMRAGDCPGALGRLDEAHARFPAGALVQERDALRVEALACSGRDAEATQQASAFMASYPGSPYAPAVLRLRRGN
jgi:hypothetical protein